MATYGRRPRSLAKFVVVSMFTARMYNVVPPWKYTEWTGLHNVRTLSCTWASTGRHAHFLKMRVRARVCILINGECKS